MCLSKINSQVLVKMIRMDLNSKYTIDIGKRVQSELKSTSMYTGNWVNEEGNWRMRK